jgi:hypothetical protein
MVDIDMIKQRLGEEIVSLVYEKADGTERVIRCTRVPSLVVQYERKTDRPSRERPADLLSVWDVDKHEWRSMYENRIKGIA